jgi:hypothetical protein
MPDYTRPPALRFQFGGMNTVVPPDSTPATKFPLAINARAYLQNAVTPRLPQSASLIPTPLAALIHSLRRMDDTTPAPIVPLPSGPNGVGTGTDVSAPGVAWSNPGNITAADGAYASATLTPAASSQGPNAPGTATSSGVVAWATPTNIEVQDGIYSTVALPANISSGSLKGSNYGFSIPGAATISGIVVTVYRLKSGSGYAQDLNVLLMKAGVPVSADKSSAPLWPLGASSISYGSSSDLWGVTWTPSDINNSGFGVLFRVDEVSGSNSITAGVDFIGITVYYTLSGLGLSDFLEGTNPGFALGGTAVLTGVFVEIKGFQTADGNLTVQLLKGGALTGVSKPATLPAGNAFISLGSNIDLWSATLAPADVNAANFGVSMQATVGLSAGTFNVDFVRITLYYYIPAGPSAGFVLIEGSGANVYVGSTQVQTGMSGKRLALVPFRPNTSVAPWMYVGDSNKLIKIRSDQTTYKTGIQEPQAVPTIATSGAGPITGQIYYAGKYRSSKTGATSNPSPTAHSQFFTAASNNLLVTFTASTDPQVDLIDVYRFGDVLNYTYVTTIQNSAPSFIDNLSAAAIANNPLMALDDYEPFPSIDIPRVGILTVSAGTLAGTVNLAWVSGDVFNVRWLGGTVIFISQSGASASSTLVLFNRPSSTTAAIAQIQPVGTVLAAGNYNFTINQPFLAAQPLPALWGPTDNAAFMFACGDVLRPGTLYFTKGNNPDSAPQTNSIEVTSPAEPLIGGTIVGGLSLAMSGERGWLIYPNFAQATASIVGVSGSPFSTVPSITDRGLFTKEGICADGGGNAYFIAKDSIRKSPAGTGSISITDGDLYNLFPHEGVNQQPYTLAGITISPPDYSQPDGMALRFAQGYVYFDHIGLDGLRHTLAYDTVNEAWSADVYLAVGTIHADNPGGFISPGPSIPIGPLIGCGDGTVRKLASTGSETGIAMTILTPAYDAGDQRAIKHFGDLYLETTTPAGVTGNFALTLYTDRYATAQTGALSPATVPAAAGIRVGSVVEINAGAGVYNRDIALVISVPVNSVGSILHMAQPSVVMQPELIGERFTDWYDVGNGGTGFVQGVIVEANTNNVAKKFAVQSADSMAIIALAEVGAGVAFNQQSKRAFSVAQPFVAHSARLIAQDTVLWQLWGVEWISVPFPELCNEWHTEAVSHGIDGWQHIGEINIAHISTSDLTMTLVPDTGPPVVITIPNSAGAQVKTYLSIPAFKYKLVSYNFTAAQPFRLWKEDIEVKIGKWGRPDSYQTVKPFGGESAPAAQV